MNQMNVLQDGELKSHVFCMRGEDQLAGDAVGCRFDGSEYLRPAFDIEFVSVESEEKAFANGLDYGLWILLSEGGFHQGTSGVAHGSSYDELLFPGRLHEHSPVALVYFTQGIVD
jgi:hypothetical protein